MSDLAASLSDKLAGLDLAPDELAELDRLLRQAESYDAPEDLEVIDPDLVPAVVQRAIVSRTAYALRTSHLVAAEAFADALELIRGSGRYGVGLSPSAQVDEAWHQFILFTYDYERFCHATVGRFVHHWPKLEGRGGGHTLNPEETCRLLEREGHPVHPARWAPPALSEALDRFAH